MRKQLNFLLIFIFTLLVASCKDEGKNADAKMDSLEVAAEKLDVKKIERKTLTPVEKEKANSVMSRLIVIPESNRFARYTVSARMADKLSNEKGSFIIFAPSNSTIESLPTEKKQFYSDQVNLSKLEGLLKSHIIHGELDNEGLMQTLSENGKAKLKTLGGVTLTVTESDGKIVVTDEKGGKATVEKSDIQASNGQVFIIDKVLNLP